jgi:hypothetical protein
VPDEMFFARPVRPGDSATLSWSEADAHQVATA